VKDLVEEAVEQIEHEEPEPFQLLSAYEAFQDDDDDGDVVAPHPLKETAGWSHFL